MINYLLSFRKGFCKGTTERVCPLYLFIKHVQIQLPETKDSFIYRLIMKSDSHFNHRCQYPLQQIGDVVQYGDATE